jgi:hypothetical protein
MRTLSLSALLAAVVAAGCGMTTSAPAGRISRGEWIDGSGRFSFRVPTSWAAASSRNPFRRPSYLVRFESPEGGGAAMAWEVARGGDGCIDAARKKLEAEDRARLLDEKEFSVEAEGREQPAWRASVEIGDARRGDAAGFCDDERAVVLEATAPTGAGDEMRQTIETIVESLALRAGGKRVAIAPPPPPSAPAPPSGYIHVVRWKGQTLGEIAKWYTGKFENWKKLAEPNGLTRPDLVLKLGRRVVVPNDLMTRDEPMPEPRAPKKAERPAAGSAAKAPAGAVESGGKAEEPEGAEEEELPSVIGPKL